MPWPKASPPPAETPDARAGTAVPSSETLRRAALRASWVRDQRLARRRLAWRWLLWAGWRIGLPLLLALALVAWLLWPMAPSATPVWLRPIVSRLQPPALTGDAVPRFNQPTHGKEP